MPLILHIADLHLVSRGSSPAIDDHKAGLVPAGGRFTHFDMLRLTLKRLTERLLGQGKRLDAIVVTGDIANKNDIGGYEAFLELLEELRPIHPGANRVVVVPGNHDVAAGLAPGDPGRYGSFVRFIRGAGFITPVLSGVDTGVVDASKHLATFAGMELIPIDSSAYSQVRMDVGISDALWGNLEGVLAGSSNELEALKRLRNADAARVDGAQLEMVRQLLSTTAGGAASPIRVVVLHHQLLPVSAKEEVKPFESLSNLGLVRQFLRDHGISIVFHGHKHTEFSYMDFISSYTADAAAPWPVRVLAGTSASAGDLERDNLIHLIDVNVELGFLAVEGIAAAVPGTAFSANASQRFDFRVPGSPELMESEGCVLIEGESVEAVYRRLLGRLDGHDKETQHVVCRIRKAPRIEDLAGLYPGLNGARRSASNEATTGAANRLEEFRELVKWWQFPVAPLTPLDQPAFTHGSRIERYDGHLDQIEAVIESLLRNHETSRGIIVLLSPEADKIADHKVEFPSFCLVQFKIEGRRHETSPTLSCTAYFRKQEVRYWWLVNLAELAELQRRICEALRQRGDQELRSIAPGSITTIAARVHAGGSAPKVQVPRVDRYLSLSRERLFAMVNALFWEQMPNRGEYRNEWQRLFEDLSPPEDPDRDGTPIAQDGLNYLKGEIERHLQVTETKNCGSVTELHRALERLLAANQTFALLQLKGPVAPEKYSTWRHEVNERISTIVQCSQECIAANG